MNFLEQWNITFAHPWLLLLLAALPLLALLLGKRGGVAAVVFSSIAPLKAIGRAAQSRAGEFLAGLLFVALALFIVALARPQRTSTISHTEASGIDIIVAIDVSGSMLIEDYEIGGQQANRIETIKNVTHSFIAGRPNDRIGIIAFGGRPFLVSPLTLDHDWLFQNLERVRVGLVEDSTAIGSAIALACSRLKDRDSKSKVIILLTDGENNAGKVLPATAAEAAKALGIKLYAIGAGTNGLVRAPLFDPRTGQLARDWTGHTAYRMIPSQFNETELKNVAQIAEGKYYRAADTESLQNIFADIDKLEKSKAEVTQYKEYHDLFPWFVGSGLAFVALHILLAQTLWRKLP